jgi:hypothetical protein
MGDLPPRLRFRMTPISCLLFSVPRVLIVEPHVYWCVVVKRLSQTMNTQNSELGTVLPKLDPFSQDATFLPLKICHHSTDLRFSLHLINKAN